MLPRTKVFPIFAAWALFSLVLNAAASGFAPPQVSISADLHSEPPKSLKSYSAREWLEGTSLIAEDTDDSLNKTLNGHTRDKAPSSVENCRITISAAPINLGPPQKNSVPKIPRHLFISVLNL
jgi:hypothetical protein